MSNSIQGGLGIQQFQGLPQDVQQQGGQMQPAPQNQGLSGIVGQLGSLASSALGLPFQMISGTIQLASSAQQTISDGYEGTKQFVSSSYEGTKQLVSDGYEGTKQLVSDGYEGTKQLVSDGYEGTKQLVSDTYEGTKQIVSDTYEGTKQLASDGYEATKQTVSSGIETVKQGVQSGKQFAVAQGTRGFESGFGSVSAKLSDGVRWMGDEQSSLVGRLPNAPGFAAATSNPGALSAQFTQVSSQNTASGQALTQLDQAFNGKAQTRHGVGINIDNQQFHAALLRGGHFVVEDGGALTDSLKDIGGFASRGSSHYKSSGHTQYGLDLDGGLGHLLIGKNDQGHSFFQLESHGTGHASQSYGEQLSELCGHTQAYLQHIGSSHSYVQIGPKGCIEGSEKDNNHVVLK